MGYQYGRLMGPLMEERWETYMDALDKEAGLSGEDTIRNIIGNVIDVAWEWFAPHVPERFHEELAGVVAGLADAGVTGPAMEALPRRIITMVDLAMSSQLDPRDLEAMMALLNEGVSRALREYYARPTAPVSPRVRKVVEQLAEVGPRRLLAPLQCSFFAAWGHRTDHGGLYATRNMDFTSDTGMHRFASIAAFVPDDGVPYVTISWVGANLGALAGMSREGLTVSAVGASSPYERIDTEPALFRAREVLERATTLEQALAFLTNNVGDDITRAPTIGYNALVAWGDPRGGGAAASAVILENNGLSSGVFRHHTDCSVESFLMRYEPWGEGVTHTPASWPGLVNSEAEAVEVDAAGRPRLFAHDGTDYVRDAAGNYVEDPAGVPLRTGYPLPCALYRGDEALAHGVRLHQDACNGPAREGAPGLMLSCNSYRNRYTVMREMTEAWAAGEAWYRNEQEIIASNGGVPAPITMDGAEAVSRAAAMPENTWDVVYDATRLVLRLSYESGTGAGWLPASEQPPFLEIRLEDLLLVD
jgi:hypothetical protein